MKRQTSSSIDSISSTILTANTPVKVAGKKVGTASKRIANALEKAKRGMQAAEQAIQQHPLKALIIAVGAGLLIEYFNAYPKSQNRRTTSAR